ncbi:unnamed protein product [Effrenium voratum]|nr:unnamed protein product [Effrenium voratum]CAJ1438847.1 unnamed protein product [Effrenium voratum]
MTARNGKAKTEDLLAAFRRKLDERIDRGERKPVREFSDTAEPPPKRTRASDKDERGPSRTESRESLDAGVRDPEKRKQQLLDGALEETEAPSRKRRERPPPELPREPRLPRESNKASPVENKERLGRGGRLAEKWKPREVQKAKGRDMASHGTFSRPRTVKVSNIKKGLEWRYIRELFESAAGKVIRGHLEENGTCAWLTFEKPDAASEAHFEFNGGELADQPIKATVVSQLMWGRDMLCSG